MTLGEKIARAREAKGWSKIKLAAEAGVTSRVLYLWENGDRDPSITNLYRLAAALGVKPVNLLP